MAKRRINDFFVKDDGVWESVGIFISRFDPDGIGKETALYYLIEDKGKELYCLVKGHEWIPDQCNIPSHKYCAWCNKPIPEELI